VAVGVPELPPAPPDALADLVLAPERRDAPPIGELPTLAPARRGLTMVSYTRLAHDLDTAVIPITSDDVLAIDPAEFDIDDPHRLAGGSEAPAELAQDDLPPGAESGLLLHDVLEIADLTVARAAASLETWARDPGVVSQLADAARARGISSRFLPHAARLVHATLTAPLQLSDGGVLPPMIAATALAREVEFGYPIPEIPGIPRAAGDPPRRGIVKGYIDALIAYDDDLWVLDYKSDVLALGGPGSAAGPGAQADIGAAALRRVREHYGIQARLYAIAADRIRGRRRFAGLLFAFVRYGIVVPVRVGDDMLAAWQDWLARTAMTERTAMSPIPATSAQAEDPRA